MKLYPYFILIPLFFLVSCTSTMEYIQIPISDRRMNMTGLVDISTNYLNEHPGYFHKFNRILTAADDALQIHEFITRGQVMKWIHCIMKEEGFEKNMPVYLFVRTVYLEGWDGAYLDRVDLSEREYLYDLISAVMGGMHLCTTCSTSQGVE